MSRAIRCASHDNKAWQRRGPRLYTDEEIGEDMIVLVPAGPFQ